jgi:predicted Fe-S protein YdhL (DUF1289 family)
MTDTIDSPCIRVCIIDQASGLCRGCYRTLKEISRWTTYTHHEKRALLAVIAQRRGGVDPSNADGRIDRS